MATAKKNVKSTPVKTITAAPPAKAISAAPPAKAIAAEPPVKVLEVKADKTEEAIQKEVVQEKKEVAKKTPVKKAPAKKTPAKKAPVKATASKTTTSTKKETIKASIQLQFAGKEYTQEDLIKIAKDVWQFDLNEKLEDIKTIQLFVKPEEEIAYYIINDTVEGCFAI